MPKHRFVLVDYNTGYIWGDPGVQYQSPIAAARATDEDVGEHGRVYIEGSVHNLRDRGTGYMVYRVPSDYPAIENGQDRAEIDALANKGELFGCVIWERAQDEEG